MDTIHQYLAGGPNIIHDKKKNSNEIEVRTDAIFHSWQTATKFFTRITSYVSSDSWKNFDDFF